MCYIVNKGYFIDMDKKQKQEQADLSFNLAEVETKEQKDVRRMDLMLNLIEEATVEHNLPATHHKVRGLVTGAFLERENINTATIARKYFDKCKHLANQNLNMALITKQSIENIQKKQIKLDDIAEAIQPDDNPKSHFYSDKIKAIAESAKLDKDILDSCIKKEKNDIDWQKNEINRDRVSVGPSENNNVINFNLEGSWTEKIDKASEIVANAMPVIETDFELIEENKDDE